MAKDTTPAPAHESARDQALERALAQIETQHLESLCSVCRREIQAWREEGTAEVGYEYALQALPAVLGMTLLGGAWFPSFLMPRWVQTVSLAIPSRWALDGFDAMTWRGFGLSAALIPSLMLLGFAAAFGAFAFARFRWEAE